MSAPVDFCHIFLESKKIIKAHSRHFLALSVLFLLPLSFLLIAFPTFQSSITSTLKSHETFLRSTFPSDPNHIKLAILSIPYSLAILLLHLCATGTITYSVFHSFYGRPVKFIAAIRSISSSLWRLFFTNLCSASVFFAFSALFFAFLSLALGYRLSSPSPAISTVSFVVLGLVFLYLQTNWTLASVVSVVETSWGVEPLRRSTYLVKGMRGLAFKLNLLFAVMFLLALLFPLYLWSGDLIPIVQIISSSMTMTILFVYSIATNTLLYMYCKALHNELASDIVEEFAQEYVSLPFDDQKIPHVVSVVQQ